MSDVFNVAIVGVGNCASSLVQGVSYYNDPDNFRPNNGLIHLQIGKYLPKDVKFVLAFDVEKSKVGRDLSEAIFAVPNNASKFAEVPHLGAPVVPAPMIDGMGLGYQAAVELKSDLPDANVQGMARLLRDYKVDVLVNYLPVGARNATYFWAEVCIAAGAAMVNAIPVFVASDPAWAKRFKDAGIPIIGDDVKSQVGATIVHRVLTQLVQDRGFHIDGMTQLNWGGNMDFYNMITDHRLADKFTSKTQSVTSLIQQNDFDAKEQLHVSPSSMVPYLKDKKQAFIELKVTGFGGIPMHFITWMEVEDSPNSAGCVLDAVRAAKLAMDRGIAGPVHEACSYLMKSAPHNTEDDFVNADTLTEWAGLWNFEPTH